MKIINTFLAIIWAVSISAFAASDNEIEVESPASKLVIKGLHLDMTAQQIKDKFINYANTHQSGRCQYSESVNKEGTTLSTCDSSALFVGSKLMRLDMTFPFFNAESVPAGVFAKEFYSSYNLEELFKKRISTFEEAKKLSKPHPSETYGYGEVSFSMPLEEINEYCILPDHYNLRFNQSLKLSLWCYSKTKGIELRIIPSNDHFGYKLNTVQLKKVKTLTEIELERQEIKQQKEQAIKNMKLD